MQYINEFITWHKLIGVDYFFIYDNESTLPVEKILHNEIQEGSVFVTRISGVRKQLTAYNNCIKRQKMKLLPFCDRIAFIDDDEFIVPLSGNLKQEIAPYLQNSGLVMSWQVYGAAGILKETEEMQIKKFNKRTPQDFPVNIHVKCIVDPKDVKVFNSPHNCDYIKGHSVTVDFNKIEGPLNGEPIHHTLWVNHYYTRSLMEFSKKIKRGATSNTNKFHYTMQDFIKVNRCAIIEDNTIFEIYSKLCCI